MANFVSVYIHKVMISASVHSFCALCIETKYSKY